MGQKDGESNAQVFFVTKLPRLFSVDTSSKKSCGRSPSAHLHQGLFSSVGLKKTAFLFLAFPCGLLDQSTPFYRHCSVGDLEPRADGRTRIDSLALPLNSSVTYFMELP